MADKTYSSIEEAKRIVVLLSTLVCLPKEVHQFLEHVSFTASQDYPYFPIPFKESEVASALKAIEASFACALHNTKEGTPRNQIITINHEKATAFLFEAYLARVNGYGKLDSQVKQYLKDTDFLQAQSNQYRRMSANLYQTKRPREYYHIHGSLEASTTLHMIGLEPFRPDLTTHEDIVRTIEFKVKEYTIEELEMLNAENRQAGIPAFTHEEFLQTPHGQVNSNAPPWKVDQLENQTPPRQLRNDGSQRALSGIKVIELCRIIAGPVIGRILAEYGADVLKITSPTMSDVPFFQVDGNMGKHAANLDLKTPEGRQVFKNLIREADVVLDGYRPGVLERLGFGPAYMSAMATARGYGIVYVNENCCGYEGLWACRPGWQQIADCVTGVAWEQGRFLGLDEPIVPPFPISDYGTGCIGAIAALTGLYLRTTVGGSWHGKASLMHYDLLLFKAGLYTAEVQNQLRSLVTPELCAMCHSNSVDQISRAAMHGLAGRFLHDPEVLEVWHSQAYGVDLTIVKPVAEIEGLVLGFKRASRPNGTDLASWNFQDDEGDYRKELRRSEK